MPPAGDEPNEDIAPKTEEPSAPINIKVSKATCLEFRGEHLRWLLAELEASRLICVLP